MGWSDIYGRGAGINVGDIISDGNEIFGDGVSRRWIEQNVPYHSKAYARRGWNKPSAE